MQQRMPALDAERTDHHIERFADGDAASAEKPVIGSCLDSQFWVRQSNDLVLTKCAFDQPRLRFGAETLEHLAQYQIAHEQRPLGNERAETVDGGTGYLIELVDPDRAVNEDHRIHDPRASRLNLLPIALCRRAATRLSDAARERTCAGRHPPRRASSLTRR